MQYPVTIFVLLVKIGVVIIGHPSTSLSVRDLNQRRKRMSRVDEMIGALRKCAKEHENEVVYTGQIVTSSLCRDVADYLEADPWHYPSKGELPSNGGDYLVCIEYEDREYIRVGQYFGETGWYTDLGEVYGYWTPIAWMPLPELPKEEA